MKLSKKKIRILILTLVILTVITTFLCSFTFKKPEDLSVSGLGRPSIPAVEHLAGIINFQVEIGQLRASEFRILAYSSNRNAVVSLISNGSISVSVSGSDVSFSGTHYIYFYDSDYGFFYNSSAASTSFPASDIFYSSIPISSSTVNINGFNSSATFGTEGYNAYSIYQYYDYIYSSCVDRDERESTIRQEAKSEGESIGFDHGYNQGFESGKDEGESIGYNEGYPDGFDTGYNYGYQFGLQDGIVTGRTEGYIQGEADGYNSGYQDGYDEGYQEGYESAEVETEIIYRDAVELDVDKLISGVASIPKSIVDTSFDINIFGLNIAGLLGAFIVIIVVAYVIKHLKT